MPGVSDADVEAHPAGGLVDDKGAAVLRLANFDNGNSKHEEIIISDVLEVTDIFSYTVLFILLVLYFVVEDKSSWATIVCAWIAECGAATAFYLWKSKNENRAKYAQRFLTKFADKYGADVALHLAEIVLKD